MKRMSILLLAGVAVLLVAATAALAARGGSGGVTGPAIYVNGDLYRTVGTPTDFSNTGAPLSSFQTIYSFDGAQPNVATAAPGDPGFRGGRWQVHALAFNTDYATTAAAYGTNGVIDRASEIEAALADPGSSGARDLGVVRLFECPVIPDNGH